jgi:hypothetical protein
LIFSEWQLKLRKELRDKILNEDKIKDSKAISIYKSQKYKQIINDLELDSVQNWTQDEENQLIDEIIEGLSHEEIAIIHKRTIMSIKSMLYKIAIKLVKDNKTTISSILVIFDLEYDKLVNIIKETAY